MVKKTWNNPQISILGVESTKDPIKATCKHCGKSFGNPNALSNHYWKCNVLNKPGAGIGGELPNMDVPHS